MTATFLCSIKMETGFVISLYRPNNAICQFKIPIASKTFFAVVFILLFYVTSPVKFNKIMESITLKLNIGTRLPNFS